MIMKRILLTIAGLLMPALTLHAQPYSIDWHKIAGGGGASSNSQFIVAGTIGQHDAGGPMAGGNYTITGGFWSLVALQTPGAPMLKIFLTSTNTVVILWPSPSPGWNLQQNADAGAPIWVASSELVNDDTTNKFIIVNPPAGNRFYRLSKP